jgi:lambda family phage portal protein
MKKVELNLIDKAIAFVNPQAAVERLASRAKLTAFEYDATQYNRQRRGPSSLSGAEGFRSNYDRVELLKRSRDLAENVGLVRGLLMKFASHCAGNISYQARTESPKVNSDVEAYWNEWWDKCDLSGRNTGSFLMQIAMMSMLRDGDFLFVLVRDQQGNLKLQGIEADRLGDPNRTYTSLNLISGIHVDQETGSPVGYDIYLRTYGNAYIFQTTVPASQAFHLYDPLRIDQYRGISAFHTAINDCVDIYEIIASEKMAAKYASSQAGIVKRNNNNASDLSSLTNDLNADNQGIKLETIEPGKVSYLEVNEDIIFPDGPSRPSGAFAEFHKILLRNICMGVGIPYSFAVDPSSMSGPTARLEMQQAGRTFRRYQKLLEDRVLRPLKNIVIADGVARGLIANNLGSKSTKGVFNFGANVSIDLAREAQANIAEFKAGLTTASSIYAEKGLDFESSMRQRALEAKLVKDLAEQYGVSPDTISDINKPIQAPAFGSPASAPEQMQDEPQDENAVVVVPPIKEQDTASRTTGSDGDIDVGEEREPTEKGATEDTQKIGEKQIDNNLEFDCGQNDDGTFGQNNTCASGGGSSSQTSTTKERYRDRIEGTDEEVRNEERKRERKLKNLKQKVVESKQREADIRKQISDLNQKIASKTTDYDVKIAAIDKVAEEMIQESKQRQVKIQQDLDKKLAAIAEKSKKRQEAIVEKYKKRKEEREAKRSVVSTRRSSSLEKNLEEGNEIESDEKIESEISNAEKNNDKLNSLVSELKAILEEIGNQEAKKKVLESLDPASIKMLIEGMMGGIELAKYDGIDFTPPQGARDAAKRALDVRETKPASQRGMTPVGIARARDLQNGVKLSPDTVRRMLNFLTRHEVDKKGATWDEQGKGWQAWHGWGGDAGYAWARKVVGQMEARDKKELAEPASCPIATQDIKTNLANRQNAVDDANYGPANPNEPNEDYWKAKADEFQGDVTTAKKMRCGNCAAFNQTNKLLGCIKKGIGEDANEVAVGGDLGYCEIFDFKCAAKRTCDAWIVGGPITDDKKKVETEFARDCGQVEDGTFGPDNKCAEGYGRPAIKSENGESFNHIGATWRNNENTEKAKQKFDALPDDAIIKVYHGTTKENAQSLINSNKVSVPKGYKSDLPTIGKNSLYVAPTIADAKKYGDEVVEIKVRKKDMLPSQEARQINPKVSLAKAFFNSFDGAVLKSGHSFEGIKKIDNKD